MIDFTKVLIPMQTRKEVEMSPVAIMEKTASSLSETYRETHNALVGQTDGDRQTTWQEFVGQIKEFDINDPSDQIKAKAALDALETVLFASVSSVSGRLTKL